MHSGTIMFSCYLLSTDLPCRMLLLESTLHLSETRKFILWQLKQNLKQNIQDNYVTIIVNERNSHSLYTHARRSVPGITYLASSVVDFNWMSSLLYHMLYYHSFQYLHLCEHTTLCINYIIYFKLSACTWVHALSTCTDNLLQTQCMCIYISHLIDSTGWS